MTRAVLLLAMSPALISAKTFYVTIAGLGGDADYEQRFEGLAAEADKSLRAAGGDAEVTTLKGAEATQVAIRACFDKVASAAKPTDVLVALLIGHGSFDGVDYKFNIPGPDLTAAAFGRMLDRVPAARQLVVDATSASGAVLKPLTHAGRIVVTATRDGMEHNATVFARFWVEALHDNAADTDKNDAVTALEAFNYAQHKTARFYEEQKRIATEHPVLSDAAHAGSFVVVRFGAAAAAAADPAKKALVAKRDELEGKIDALKQQKNMMDPGNYKAQLTVLLIQLAQTQAEIDK